jgi:heme/copper-type cytochrome/quinol oxidase subunit 4
VQYAETDILADYLSFKSHIASMASTSKLLKEIVLYIQPSVLLVTAVMMVMIVMIVKMTLQLLMLLLMKRIARSRKKAKVILLVTVTITVILFGRTRKIIMVSMNTRDKTLSL